MAADTWPLSLSSSSSVTISAQLSLLSPINIKTPAVDNPMDSRKTRVSNNAKKRWKKLSKIIFAKVRMKNYATDTKTLILNYPQLSAMNKLHGKLPSLNEKKKYKKSKELICPKKPIQLMSMDSDVNIYTVTKFNNLWTCRNFLKERQHVARQQIHGVDRVTLPVNNRGRYGAKFILKMIDYELEKDKENEKNDEKKSFSDTFSSQISSSTITFEREPKHQLIQDKRKICLLNYSMTVKNKLIKAMDSYIENEKTEASKILKNCEKTRLEKEMMLKEVHALTTETIQSAERETRERMAIEKNLKHYTYCCSELTVEISKLEELIKDMISYEEFLNKIILIDIEQEVEILRLEKEYAELFQGGDAINGKNADDQPQKHHLTTSITKSSNFAIAEYNLNTYGDDIENLLDDEDEYLEKTQFRELFGTKKRFDNEIKRRMDILFSYPGIFIELMERLENCTVTQISKLHDALRNYTTLKEEIENEKAIHIDKEALQKHQIQTKINDIKKLKNKLISIEDAKQRLDTFKQTKRYINIFYFRDDFILSKPTIDEVMNYFHPFIIDIYKQCSKDDKTTSIFACENDLAMLTEIELFVDQLHMMRKKKVSLSLFVQYKRIIFDEKRIKQRKMQEILRDEQRKKLMEKVKKESQTVVVRFPTRKIMQRSTPNNKPVKNQPGRSKKSILKMRDVQEFGIS